MYATPVVYPLASSGLLGWANRLNPVTYILETSRNLLTGEPLNFLFPAIGITFCALLLLFLAWTIVHITLPRVIERLGM